MAVTCLMCITLHGKCLFPIHMYILHMCVCECMYMYVKFMINEVKKLIFCSFKMALITT